MKRKIGIFILGICLMTSKVEAATIFFETQAPFQVGVPGALTVKADLEGESMNVVDARISFQKEKMTFTGYDLSTSVVPVWNIEPKEENGVVYFAGIVPGGVDRLYDPQHPDKKSIVLGTLFFTPHLSGATDFSFIETLLLRNDGQGTPLLVTEKNASFTILEKNQTGQVVGEKLKDDIPPEPFRIGIIEHSVFGRTPRLAVFQTTDTNGVARYEARINARKFETVVSPYPLPLRMFGYTFTVRAYDFSDNVREESIRIPGSGGKWGIVLGGLVIVLILFYNKFTRRVSK